MIYTISRAIFALILRSLLRIKVSGRENIPKKGAFILASNHLSILDPPLIGVACSRKLNFMAKEDLFAGQFARWWMHAVGCFPVKRNAVDIRAIKTAIKRLEEGKGLLLFPEGTRQKGYHSNNEPEPGIGFLVSRVNVPIIPAFVKGTEIALPKGAKFIRPAKASVCFGEQISIERGMPYETIAKLVMERIRHLSY